ncbi:hypothetical protein DENSPDRAFT_883972 [Dentipellis sp. KUC8613]|nr:hypothetical protein DENSPDRAFT_883972 [Dentipellis sp. KUC8613]
MMTNIDDKTLWNIRYYVPVLLDDDYLQKVIYHSDDEFDSSDEDGNSEGSDSSADQVDWFNDYIDDDDDDSSEEGGESELDVDGLGKSDDHAESDAASLMDWTSD